MIYMDLDRLTPSKFENLVYELLLELGLKNLVWRTPGADQGRDIEGHFERTDFSGQSLREIWYVECKKYASSISWPIVYEKVSFADNHNADFLLIASNSQPSPPCINEITAWNDQNRRPKIRFWSGAEIEHALQRHEFISAKYGLSSQPENIFYYSISSIEHLTKMLYAAYSELEIKEHTNTALESSVSFLDLVLKKTDDICRYGYFVNRPFSLNDLYDWAQPRNLTNENKPNIDKYGLRSFLSALRFTTNTDTIDISICQPNPKLSGLSLYTSNPLQNSAIPLLNEISAWSDTEFQIGEYQLKIFGRHR